MIKNIYIVEKFKRDHCYKIIIKNNINVDIYNLNFVNL